MSGRSSDGRIVGSFVSHVPVGWDHPGWFVRDARDGVGEYAMSDEILRTPSEWEAVVGIKVIDPDGWDRRDFARSWAEPLTLEQFTERSNMSTCYHGPRP